ncbi:hypothetical protein HPO96_34455 [Kribbella sandramycini]|uniref:Lipoprotein n=1 Tax=Kribbella sandramycini TaxID=60450 RepID=A0A7Y4P2H5_9ACTN|nr:hypothetical protein [Kribbella sandramycini]MBB6570136.1 hypothetical protein [Kribbella sandramycini]NOL45362.1 hypothetical protein [Kribbella sandramycini]
MNSRRIPLAAAALLALTLTGCSDSGTATEQPTTRQSAPAPDKDEPAAGAGTKEGFCAAIADGGGVDLAQWNQPQADPALREKLAKRFTALVDAAPDDLKPAMRDVAAGYELVSAGKVAESDQATIAKYATAIQKLNQWMHANCPNLKLPTPAAG